MKNSLKFTLLLFISISVLSCNHAQTSKTVTEFGEINVITPEEFKIKSANYTIIDVRTPGEFAQGHIEGAININVLDSNFLEQMGQFNTKEPIFIYCKSGNRSTKATKMISELGFEDIYDLQGGILNWSRNNQPISK
jgi:rhodanese-related sulfurtransferase